MISPLNPVSPRAVCSTTLNMPGKHVRNEYMYAAKSNHAKIYLAIRIPITHPIYDVSNCLIHSTSLAMFMHGLDARTQELAITQIILHRC